MMATDDRRARAGARRSSSRTTALDRRPVPPPAAASPGSPPPAGPRRSRRGPILLLLALLLVAGARRRRVVVRLGALHLDPRRARHGAEAGREEARGRRPRRRASATRRTPRPCPRAASSSADPAAGERDPRRRHRHAGALARQGALRRARARRARPRTQAQDALLAAHLAFGKAIGRWSETVPEGTVLRSDPAAGQTLRPGTVVDLFVSKGRKPLTVKDWTGKDADEAEAALEQQGLRGQPPRRSTPTRSPRAT